MAKKKGKKTAVRRETSNPDTTTTMEELTDKKQPVKETASANATEPASQTHDKLTNTNTDFLCADQQKPSIFTYLYQYNLWTGLYMLNSNEKAAFHVFGWAFVICASLWMYVFMKGFRDGFLSELVPEAE